MRPSTFHIWNKQFFLEVSKTNSMKKLTDRLFSLQIFPLNSESSLWSWLPNLEEFLLGRTRSAYLIMIIFFFVFYKYQNSRNVAAYVHDLPVSIEGHLKYCWTYEEKLFQVLILFFKASFNSWAKPTEQVK